jgi:DNA polymerase-1
MRQHRHAVGGQPVVINVVETEDDLEGFRDFIRGNLRFLGLDTETTGLEMYSSDFRCRTVQFGTPDEAWVIPVERGGRFHEDVRVALESVQGFVFHNAAFDLQVIEQTFGIPMEQMWPKTTDTQILAKLLDPRPKEAGGFGHKLEEVVARFIDRELAESVKGLMVKLAKEHKTTKEKIWRIIDLDHPEFQLYAGMDPIFAARMLRILLPKIPDISKPLIPYEHELAEVCSYVERRGFLLDVDYSQQLSDRWLYEKSVWEAILLTEYGLENCNSNEMVADVIEEAGWKIKGRTPTGNRQVNAALFDEMAAKGGAQGELASIIQEAQKLGKWRKTWVQKFLDMRDLDSRCHPSINPLQARTSRMSITGIPAQTLPAEDWTVRRCFLADEGELIASVDYQTQELRVLAALSGDQNMIQAFLNNADLHQITADAAGVARDVGKTANFQKVYGGGAAALAKAVGISFATAKAVHEAFSEQYPGVERLNKKLQREASSNGYIITPTGRRLPVDSDRAYSALNYLIQSSSRDVTSRAIIRLHKAGLTPYIRLPIHDEVVASLPEAEATDIAQEIGRLMAEQIGPVLIGTDPEVGGRSWGSLYVKGKDVSHLNDPFLLIAA